MACARLPIETNARLRGPREQRGLVLIALLIVLALLGVALASVTESWAMTRQRELEQQLLFVGQEYRQAILRYYQAAPAGTRKVLPEDVADLLKDNRYPNPVQHLRRAYPDPMTADGEWGEIRIGGRLAGIYSKSERAPLKQKSFPPGYEGLEAHSSYREWVFAVSAAGQPTFINPDAVVKPDPSTAPPEPRHPSARTPS